MLILTGLPEKNHLWSEQRKSRFGVGINPAPPICPHCKTPHMCFHNPVSCLHELQGMGEAKGLLELRSLAPGLIDEQTNSQTRPPSVSLVGSESTSLTGMGVIPPPEKGQTSSEADL